jgi:hypothetical protein
MDQGPLVSEQINAGARFLSEFQKYAPIQTAFWLKESEEGAWYLYVVSDQITDDNFDVAYGEVVRITGELRDPWFDPFQVKVAGIDDPLAKAVLEIQKQYSGGIATRYRGRQLGNVNVEEIYVYPLPITAGATP